MKTVKRGRPKKPTKPGEHLSHVAVQVSALVTEYGTQEKLAKATGGTLSRPLLALLAAGRVPATSKSIAGLCRSCTTEGALALIQAFLFDQLAEISAGFRPTKSSVWNGSTHRL